MLHNPGDHIVLDLRYGAAEQVNGNPVLDGGGGTKGGRYVGFGNNRRAISRRRLRPILKNLIFSEEFRLSEQTIELPDVDQYRVRDLFVNFSDITDAHVGSFKGFWGDIHDTRQSNNGARWINTGDKDNVSVIIGKDICTEFLDYHGATWAELEGMHFLVFGQLNRKQESNKLWIRPRGIEYTAIYDGM